MPVTSRWLDEPPPPRPGLAVRVIAGAVIGLIVILTVRIAVLAVFPPSASRPTPTAPAPTRAPLPALVPAEAPAPPQQAATPTPTPAPAPAPAPAAPTIGDACPPAVTPPDGARVGWLARAAGCPDIALGNLDGVRQWVRRDRLSDDVYNQLPEVEP